MTQTTHLPMLPAFARKEDGNTSIMFGLMIVPMLSIIGAAIDFSNAAKDQSVMQQVLDAAALASVGEYNISHDATAANQRLVTFVQQGLVGTGLTLASGTSQGTTPSGQVSLTNANINTATGTVSPVASLNVATGVLGIAGIQSIPATARSTAGLSTSNSHLEIGMMIDLTGSMGQSRNGQAKVDGLRAAGQDFLNILFPTGNNPNIRVGVAPMADFVNAGPYAAAATGQAATGVYVPGTNLAQTKQGTYYGTYTGVGGGGNGQGFGATASNSTSGGTVFNNGYCSNPNQGHEFEGEHGDHRTLPVGTPAWGNWWDPRVQYGRFAFQSNGRWYASDDDDTPFLPVANAGCSSTPAPTGPLITCVTERTATHTNPYDHKTDQYDDADPTVVPVGTYNQNSPGSVKNYSSDGKCNVAGRELPKVIPLTSDKPTLANFFTTATIGGGTPGHIGTAWAWYLVSPNWASVWPTGSDPMPYNTPNTKKFVVIMTDGEYNEQYSTTDSRTQALALCSKMKAAGVTVYTVGFGFSSGGSDATALTLLQQCATSPATTFVPYDSAALRTAFQQIGTQMLTSSTQVVLTP